MKQFLLFLCILVTTSVVCQELEVIHNISSDQMYTLQFNESESLDIYLNYYSPAIVDYETLPYFFASGWYELNNKKTHLVGIYRPSKKLVLFVLSDEQQKYIDCIRDGSLNVDTTAYLERFEFSLDESSINTKKGIWYNGTQNILIDNIDVDNNTVKHNIFLRGGDLFRHVNRTIDITDFVIEPFGNNDIYLEDYNIELHSSFTDESANLHVLLVITNEYVIPSSLSSGGYYYLKLDKYQVIRDNAYFETYNQGKYISYRDENFIHPSKQRFLILADWSDSQIIGSFFIENSKIEIENEWKSY